MTADRERRAALSLYQSGQPVAAAEACERLLRIDPRDAYALWLLAFSRTAMNQSALAREAALRGLRLRPEDPSLLHALAAAAMQEGRFDEARDTVSRALRASPDEPALVSAAAEIRFQAGDFEEAASVLAAALDRGIRHISLALAFALVCPRLDRRREGIALLEAALAEPDRTVPQTISACFSLGELYDGLGDYERAFRAFERANSIRGPRPDAGRYLESMEQLIWAWTPERARALPRAREADPTPVFIVGMPRSGTSLTEQILASHPAVFGAGERETLNRLVREAQQGCGNPAEHLLNPESINARAVERMSRAALRDLRTLAPDASRIVDKNPVNFLHQGLVSMIFPGARVLNCVRDARDTCLSCYFHNLSGVHILSGNLALVGKWHRACRRVMDHWKSALELPVMDVVYEDLVADPETITRRIAAFIGIDWREEMLRFHQTRRAVLTPSVDQVRRPLYASSVGRWKHYEPFIGPLIETLDA